MKVILAFAFIYLSMTFGVDAQKQNFKFKRLTTLDGLSQNHVSAVLKDHEGFMWFATDEGLNKYDGYTFTTYKYLADDAQSISNNFVFDILEDSENNLWIGTGDGLNKLNREKDIFIHYKPDNSVTIIRDIFLDSKKRFWIGSANGLYLFNSKDGSFKEYKHNEKNSNSLSNDFIYKIAEGEEGDLWIATKDGLNRFDPDTEKFSLYTASKSSAGIGSNWVKAVYKDYKGNMWIGTLGGGIALFNPKENSFTRFVHDPADDNSICYNDILSFANDSNNKLWIGTENGGISIFDYETKTFSKLQFSLGDNHSLSSNSVYSLYKDDIGNMWAGTWSGGVNFLPKFGEKFHHYAQVPHNDKSLDNSIVLSIAEDGDGKIWIGTDGGGLNCFDQKKQLFTHFKNKPSDKNSLGSNYVLSIVEVEKGLLALGYHRGGFDLFNTETEMFTHHESGPDNYKRLSDLTVTIIFKDHDGDLWIGTWGGGLGLYDRLAQKITWYQNDPQNENSLSNNFIHSIGEDKDGNLWTGTENGTDSFNKRTSQFTHYKHDPNNKSSISSNIVEAFLKDHLGNLWLATGGGLNLFMKEEKSFRSYTEKDGLPNNMIRSVLEDAHGNLWLSSNKGLSRFNPVAKVFRNYTTTDGLQGNEFKSHASYLSKDGQMFFGGSNGFNVFYPDSLKENTFVPPVRITDFEVFNKSVRVRSGDSILHKHINETKEIKLSFDQSVFTFVFAALNYTSPEENQYAYKLEGFDKEWNFVGNKRSATYTNLDAGEYIFHVRGSNNDKVWNEQGTSVKLIITPPFWLTWWFRLMLFVFVAGSFFTFYWIRVTDIRKQQQILEAQVKDRTKQLALSMEEERRARQEAEQATRAKSVFLATMSHEIRTPMNGVIGMASLLAETPLNSEQREYTETIQNCGESLLKVINDILDFSKIESGKMEMEQKDFDLRNCVEEVLDVFAGKAASVGLDLIYQMDYNVPPQIVGDSHRLRQVLMNLVGNAIKFTHQGEIFIRVSRQDQALEDGQLELAFEVRDTGIGIEESKVDKLFKAFSQVDSSTTRKYGGTGLGLAISEKLVELMGGKIKVASRLGYGTVFSFTIRAGASKEPLPTYVYHNIGALEGKNMLVVDDNFTNLSILKSQLEQWKIIPSLADSGAKGLELLQKNTFDLVLTDMQMPEMNGIQFAQQVKQKYPHLPLILLSSVGDERNKLHSDLFASVLTKPVRQHVLCKHILAQLQMPGKALAEESNVIQQKLSNNFSQQYPLHILIAEDNPVNQKLAARVLTKLGYSPEIAPNGLAAFEVTGKKHFDLIFMDVQMPEMDGLEATRKIRLRDNMKSVIIAMTANASKDDRDECLNSGMNDYISKPIKLEDLVSLIEKWALHLKANGVPNFPKGSALQDPASIRL